MLRTLRRVGWAPKLGGFVITIFVIVAAAAPVLAPHHPEALQLGVRLEPPSWLGGKGGFFMGSDQVGRDVLSRLLYGVRTSLGLGIGAATLSAVLGTLLGVMSGYGGGFLDAFLMRLADVQLAFPFLVLAITIVAVLGPGVANLLLVLAIWGWANFARVARGEVLAIRDREFVQASAALGASFGRIVWRHLLPNILAKVVVIWTYMVAQMVVAEGALSFLGLGVPEPMASLGSMMNEGRVRLSTAWWITTMPGVGLMALVLGVNLAGDGLADALNPRAH